MLSKTRAKRAKKKQMWKPTGKVYTKIGYLWKPTGRTFTLVGNECPLTRITPSPIVPTRTPDMPESKTDKPEVKLVYKRKKDA